MAMALEAFKATADVFSCINTSREFFNWAIPGIVEALRSRLMTMSDQDNRSAQNHQIQEKREQLRQLENDLWKLGTTMAPKMHDLIDRVKWQSHKKPVTDLLPHIKGAVYDAEDLLDEFSYYAIKLEVEESKNLGEDHMEGAFRRFYNSIKDCDHFNKVKEIQNNLDHIYDQSKDLGFHQAQQKFDRSIRPETSTFSNDPEIFGREKELEQLVKMLGVGALKRGRADGKARMTELPVLPIVGTGGVGKTTLAQQICNDVKVKLHFDCIIWVCVSDDFEIKRLTKEILQDLGQQTSDNLNSLMVKLGRCVKSKKSLLVLNDMWEDTLEEDGARWKRFCKPLENGLQGSMILVTTRLPKVANLVNPNPNQHKNLEGLEYDVFWEFFKLCAFGSRSSCNDPELECIGKDILPKLHGSPLAAKTLGRLLRRDLDRAYWESILESELWLLEQKETEILPALRLSYMYLPPHLKICFLICALYPKDHKFQRGVLADIWIAQGYLEPQHASSCFDDLVNRSFFQKAGPSSSLQKYLVHDLIHDMAQLVSKDEFFIIKHASDINKIPPSVRHLSIFSKEKTMGFSNLKSICHNREKLRSLICNSRGYNFGLVPDCWFRELLKIRVLSIKLSGVKQLPESLGNLKQLRYLPSSIRCLHHLKIIEAWKCEFKRFPQGFSDVISLQTIKSMYLDYNKDHSDRLCLQLSSGSGEQQVQMTDELPHWNLQRLDINYYSGESCPSWLRPDHLPRLRSLEFRECENIQSISFFEPLFGEEVSDNFHRLEDLNIKCCPKINWQSLVALPTSLRKLALYKSGYSMNHFVRCFRDLTSLTHLHLSCLESLTSIPLQVWSTNLPSLEDLHIEHCSEITSIGSVSEASSSSSVGVFSSLAKLTIKVCKSLFSLDEFLQPAYLPVVKIIHIQHCGELTSLPADMFHGFSCLQKMCIQYCPKLHTQSVMTLPSSLKKLSLINSGVIEIIDNRQVGSSPTLEKLEIWYCPDLRSIGGSVTVGTRIESVRINGCPQLTEIEQPFYHGDQYVFYQRIYCIMHSIILFKISIVTFTLVRALYLIC